jgi:hypothetical protein
MCYRLRGTFFEWPTSGSQAVPRTAALLLLESSHFFFHELEGLYVFSGIAPLASTPMTWEPYLVNVQAVAEPTLAIRQKGRTLIDICHSSLLLYLFLHPRQSLAFPRRKVYVMVSNTTYVQSTTWQSRKRFR